MSDPDEVKFAAVIVIALPEDDHETSLTVVLAPADPVSTQDGTLKPLRECTLAELQHFAKLVEIEALADFESVRLDELVDNDVAEISVTILDDDGEPEQSDLPWSEHVVILPDLHEPDSGNGSIDAEAEQTAESAPPMELAPDDETTEQASKETMESGLDLAVEESEPEPDVAVSESEPVYEERESEIAEPTQDGIATGLPTIRILGRRRPLNHPTRTAADILLSESAFRNAQAHALSSLDREVAGVLVGPPPEKQPDGRYVVHVSDTIIAKHTRMQGASVTYTPESWRYVNDRLAEMFPDESAVIVGWYHTHPGFGIFLSGMDQFIHQNFFTQIWHIAMVLDPLARRSGFFCWDRQKSSVDAYDFPWPDWAPGSW